MNTFQVMTLLGIGGLMTAVWIYIIRFGKHTASSIKAIRLGVQAVLRAQMISDYNYYLNKGYAPIYAKENFQNCWNQYEALGANGVMNDIYKKFMALPDRKPDD
jgi:hypothetical protein